LERSGPSIEVKVVLLVAAAVVLQDLILLAMYLAGARPTTIQIVLGGLLVLAIVLSAVWGNALSRAVRRLTRACYVARKGDTKVLSGISRTDELGELHGEINMLIDVLRELSVDRGDLESTREVVRELERSAPEMTRSSHELLVSLKELREGAAAESSILRKIAGYTAKARAGVPEVGGEVPDCRASYDAAARLKSIEGLARELELLADRVVDEIARPEVDETSLARAVNGLRDAARTMSEVAEQASVHLERRRSDLEALRRSAELVDAVSLERADGGRVAELMERSAANGLTEATRLASLLRKLGTALRSHAERTGR
jgi:methyl-accepting chemotaxis protein